MAVRRPSPPRLQAGRPGASPQPTPAQLAPAQHARAQRAPGRPDPAPAASVPAATAVTAVTAATAATLPIDAAAVGSNSPVSPTTQGRAPIRPARRRIMLLAGAAAAVVVPVTAMAAGPLLRREGPGALSAGSAQGIPGVGIDEEALFVDVPAGSPGADAIRWAHRTGVQPALSPAEYAPAAEVTRGDVAVALHRLAGSPDMGLGTAPTLFTDLGEDPARVSAVLWLHGRGALWGDAELRVHPDAPATRDCTAMMLAALMRPALAGMGVTWDASAEVSLPQPEDPGSAQTDVAWLAAAGMAPDSFATNGWAGEEGVTRAELAASLHRADSVISGALG